MRISGSSYQPRLAVQPSKREAPKAGDFQQFMRSHPSVRQGEDTITISSQTTAPTEAPIQTASYVTANIAANVAAPSDPEILPSDSIQVKLDKLQQIAQNADYTGMSYAEIHKTIWDRYNTAFDGNLAGIHFGGFGQWGDISNQFEKEIMHAVLNPMRREVANEAGMSIDDQRFDDHFYPMYKEITAATLGYNTTDVDEIEASILTKYQGKDTLMDFLNMQGELYQTGVLRSKMGFDGVGQYMSMLHRQMDQTYDPDPRTYLSQEQLDPVLHSKFNASGFFNGMRTTLANTTFSNFDFDIEEVLYRGIDDMMAALERG